MGRMEFMEVGFEADKFGSESQVFLFGRSLAGCGR
jgi:hypothetical protein